MKGYSSMFLAALALVLAAPLSAKLRIRTDIGQTFFNLEEVRMASDALIKDATSQGGSVKENKVDHSANFAELGFDIYVNERLSLGPELGYMTGNESSFATDVTVGTIRTTSQSKYHPSLIPVLVRLGWDAANPDVGWYYGFDFGIGIGIGYLVPGGNVLQEDSSTSSSVLTQFNGETHAGVAPLAKAGLHGGYRFGLFGLGASLGYRYATFSQLQDPNNRPLKNSKGDPLAVDLGGIEYNAEFAFNF